MTTQLQAQAAVPAPQALPSTNRVERRPPIVTTAETADCTCPEPCERDHEND
jgi:hypothetical protein